MARKIKHTVASIVQDFLDYFEARGHTVVPSAPLLPEDPTLLFTAAGMVPFKAYYNAPDKAPYPTAASVQKCLRAGGKQSDLENVGRTLRHHTFFEMLGNFSFGDYFKKQAIEYAWELSVDGWKMDRDRLWVSVYEDDDEAHDLWAKHIGFPVERIVRLGKKDNFWGPVGDTGVCGPSSELYYDTGQARGCSRTDCGPGCDCDRYIEYWNLVFPQFFYTEKGKFDPLPRPGIDTGLGLERLAFILQGAQDNFHTDEFLPIRRAVAGALPKGVSTQEAELAVNAASDHVRALTFALAEGIMPSNEGRGYVLRRLLRRALTKMHPFGVREPFLAGAVDAVIASMRTRYPELVARGALVKEMITAEEDRFLATLELGMNRLEAMIESAGPGGRISGSGVFQLYDTFGFPPELTRELAQERGLEIDSAGFDSAMNEQKERARQARTVSTGTDSGARSQWRDVGTADRTEFIGYDSMECDAEVAQVARADATDRVRRQFGEDGDYSVFTTNQTVFYPEGGGQVGDRGTATFGDVDLDVLDTYRSGDHIAHLVSEGATGSVAAILESSPSGVLRVDFGVRLATMRNHTATHLLHAALREVLGDHVAQAGSLVEPGRLRFDFHHYQAMKTEEVAEVEKIVSEVVMADLEVTSRIMHYREAIDAGAMALFGEKYGDEVRVISIDDVSLELCGGTHLKHTGEIGGFFVRQEGAVGSGVRRVEALTGSAALDYAQRTIADLHRVSDLLKVSPHEVERRVRALLEESDALTRQARQEEAKRAQDQAGDAMAGAEDIGGVSFVATQVDAPTIPALRQYGDALRGKIGTGVALVCQAGVDRPVCLVVVSDGAIQGKGITAGDLTRRIADTLGFRGGGKSHMAQVGLPNVNAFKSISDFVKEELKSLV